MRRIWPRDWARTRRSLERVLHVLADVGIFADLGDGRFGLTPLGELLRSGVPGSARRAAILWTEEWHWRAYGHLTSSVRTGKPGMHPAHGRDFWGYLADHAEAAAAFNDVMSTASSLRAQALAASYDFSSAERVVDVGGGEGRLVSVLLQAHPHLRGVVFDLPGVVGGAQQWLLESGLSSRGEVIAGDFLLQEVPSGGDIYVLSWILHDWDDEAAGRILANCRAGMDNASRLLVIEMVLPGPDAPKSPQAASVQRLAKALDLEMLAVVGGRERSGAEYEEMLATAGFRVTRMRGLEPTPWSVIEGTPT